MSTIQLIGIGIAVVILIILIIALIVTRRRDRARGQAAEAPARPVAPPTTSAVLGGAPRGETPGPQGGRPTVEEPSAFEEPPAVVVSREHEAAVPDAGLVGTSATAVAGASAATDAGAHTMREEPSAGGGQETGTAVADEPASEAATMSVEPAPTAGGAALWNGGPGPTDGHQDDVDLWGRPLQDQDKPPLAVPEEPPTDLHEAVAAEAAGTAADPAPTSPWVSSTGETPSGQTPAPEPANPPDGTRIWTPAAGIVDEGGTPVEEQTSSWGVEPVSPWQTSAETTSDLSHPEAEEDLEATAVPRPEVQEDLGAAVSAPVAEDDLGAAVVSAPEILDEPVVGAAPATAPVGEPAPEAGPPEAPPVPGAAPQPSETGAPQEPRLVRLCDIISTTNTQIVNLDDPDVRRMLRELVQSEVDLAQQYKQLGQNIDAVLQLTEAQKICRALSMESHAKLLEQMIRELQV